MNPAGCVCSDLSQGLEPKKLPVIRINHNDGATTPKPFTYISEVDVSSFFSFTARFAKPKEKVQVDADLEFQVFNTAEKGWALRTVKAIKKPNTILFEYTGKLSLYVPMIDEDDYICSFIYNDGCHYFLDANKKGNLARFCNHSCEPNCIAKIVMDETEEGLPRVPCVLIRTLRPIKQEEELTLDYGRKWWKAKSELDCECGSTECKYTGIPGRDIRLQLGRYTTRSVAKKCAMSRAEWKQTATKAAHRGPPMSSSGSAGGRTKQLASKVCGRPAPRKIVARKGCGGFRPRTVARNHVHPIMKVEGGGEEEEDETDDEEEEEADKEDNDEEEEVEEEDKVVGRSASRKIVAASRKIVARKSCGGFRPPSPTTRKIVARKGCGGLIRPPTTTAARNHVHPTMKMEGGGEEQDEEDED